LDVSSKITWKRYVGVHVLRWNLTNVKPFNLRVVQKGENTWG
jgi:hypothetical protein